VGLGGVTRNRSVPLRGTLVAALRAERFEQLQHRVRSVCSCAQRMHLPILFRDRQGDRLCIHVVCNALKVIHCNGEKVFHPPGRGFSFF
jgi:hypothetical protein